MQGPQKTGIKLPERNNSKLPIRKKLMSKGKL